MSPSKGIRRTQVSVRPYTRTISGRDFGEWTITQISPQRLSPVIIVSIVISGLIIAGFYLIAGRGVG